MDASFLSCPLFEQTLPRPPPSLQLLLEKNIPNFSLPYNLKPPKCNFLSPPHHHNFHHLRPTKPPICIPPIQHPHHLHLYSFTFLPRNSNPNLNLPPRNQIMIVSSNSHRHHHHLHHCRFLLIRVNKLPITDNSAHISFKPPQRKILCFATNLLSTN